MQVTVFDPDLDWSRPHEFLLVMQASSASRLA
jgi:hypothetical protein